MSEQRTTDELVASLREGDRILSAAAPVTYTDHVMARAADEIERLRKRERALLEAHTGCGCEPTCKVCIEKGYT